MVVSSIDVMDKLRHSAALRTMTALTISFNLEGQENDKDSYAKRASLVRAAAGPSAS